MDGIGTWKLCSATFKTLNGGQNSLRGPYTWVDYLDCLRFTLSVNQLHQLHLHNDG